MLIEQFVSLPLTDVVVKLKEVVFAVHEVSLRDAPAMLTVQFVLTADIPLPVLGTIFPFIELQNPDHTLLRKSLYIQQL